MTRFAVLVLCPGATYSDLLLESREHDVTVLEMIPFSTSLHDYLPYFQMPSHPPILFVLRTGQSLLAEGPDDVSAALAACCDGTH